MTSRVAREALLGRLVACDSRSQVSNREITDLICDYIDSPGVRIVRHASPDGTKLNLIAIRGPRREDGNGLILSGHMDTVPFGEAEWETDPLVLTCREGRFLGRGVCDMKGFLALAVERFAAATGPLAHPLALLFTYDEELGTLGARHLVEHPPVTEPLPRAVVIGEPTSLGVVRMHKGHLKLRIVLKGHPGHSAYPAAGRNAIEMAGRAIQALTELGRALQAEAPPEAAAFTEAPYATLSIATIAGGAALNVIPDRCTLELGVRLLPGMTGAAVTERVRGAVEDVLDSGSVILEPISESPAMATPDGAPIHRVLCALTGQRGTGAVSYTTDGGWLAALRTDCVVCGPGSIQAAHRQNEWLAMEEFERGAALLEQLVAHHCGEGAVSS